MTTIRKPPHGSLDWLLIRHRDDDGRCRFGASEAPTLMGANPWANLTDLAIEKWSEPQESEPNAAMERGNVLEPALIAHAATLLGQPVTTPDVMYAEGRLIATLDGITDDGTIIVEAKTTTAYSSDDECPAAYWWQVQAQLACVPTAHYGIVVVLDKRMRLGQWKVPRSEFDIAALMARADVIGDIIDRHELPNADETLTEAQVKAVWPKPTGTVALPTSAVAVIDEWQAAREARMDAEEREQVCRDRLAAMMGAAEVGTVDGHPVLSFKSRRAVLRIDTKAMERDHPSLVEQYRVPGLATRVLRTASGRGGSRD